MTNALPRARQVLEDGMAAGLQVGAQLHVRLAGELVANLALGLAAPGKAMTPDSMMTWLSCSKIVSSVAFARIWEAGLVGLDDPVAAHLPEFAQNGKGGVTLRHLWTHTCGLLGVDNALFAVRYTNTNEENVALICAARPDAGWVPGRKAGYHTSAVFLLLAEIVRRKRGRPFPQVVREEVLLPLGMSDSFVGMTAEEVDRYADRLGETFDTTGAEPKPGSWAPDAPHQLTHVMPGGNGRGPMRELARLLEMLRRGGELDGTRILSPQTVAAMTARHRTGLMDRSWGLRIDWGLGLTLDSKIHHEGRPHLYGYGRHASPRAFGHSGFRTTTAFCDPDAQLVLACSWNGMVADDQVHSARQNALAEAIYEDLGLAP
ncbi:serine hydrolase domain-containing protein [Phenylobacterium terrae]|uniref:Serine hydrolase domain-containing protein n=1 Tax=Phenylobacterium terrae TaxID=2665495 RepID=A0ABW4MVW2_9CAUL